MKESRVKAFFREFEFLGQYVKMNRVHDARVSRIDKDFLRMRKVCELVDCFLAGDVKIWTDVLILDRSGNKLIEVGIRNKPWWKFWVRRDFIESIGEALVRLGPRADEAFFVLTFARKKGELVLYKPPKVFTISAWIEEQIRREQTALQGQMAEIDSEATPA